MPIRAVFLSSFLVGLVGLGCGGAASTDPSGGGSTAATDSPQSDTEPTSGATSRAQDGPSSGANDSGTTADESESESESESDSNGGDRCSLRGFEPEPTEWELPGWPGSRSAFENLAGPGRCTGGLTDPTYVLFDLDPDDRPDLVVTSLCDDDVLGAEHWIVFENRGDGFDDAQQWSLPTWPNAQRPFPTLSNNGCNGDQGPDYAITDLDGDDAPDLVVTYACGDGEVGDSQWLVFPNTGQGFGDATEWSLPDWPSSEAPFPALAGQESCEPSNRPTYALVDLTSDGLSDLVVTAACGDGGVGDAQWLVFPNEGNGFGAAVAWSLPPWPNAEFPFLATSANRSCDASNTPAYGLADLDGDGELDLVVTQTCGDDPTGRDQWLVFPNQGDGFGDATTWTLPQWPTVETPFPSLGTGENCDAGPTPTYTLADLDQDQRPDLVMTYACGEGAIGSQRWLVFPNDGTGFTEPQDFALPTWPGADPFTFDTPSSPSECEGTATRPAHSFVDLTGEGRASLVVTFACGEGGLGSERWMRFARDCG